MDHGVVTRRARDPTLDEFFPSVQAYELLEKLNDHEWALDDEEDLRRFIRGGLAAK